MILILEDAPGFKETTSFHAVQKNGRVVDLKPRYPMEAYGVTRQGDRLYFEALIVNHPLPEGVLKATTIDTPPFVRKDSASAVSQVVRETVRIRCPGLDPSPNGKKYEPHYFELEE